MLSVDTSSESDSDSEFLLQPKKTTRKLPEMWTRVKPRSLEERGRYTVFDIKEDLSRDKVLRQIRRGVTSFKGSFLFDPDTWKGKD